MKRTDWYLDARNAATEGLELPASVSGVICDDPVPWLGTEARIICCGEPPLTESADGSAVTFVNCRGLEETARQRDRWPAATWVPMVQIERSRTRYGLNRSDHGGGFIVYAAEPASIRGFGVVDELRDLRAWLARSAQLGFDTLWFHAPDAEKAGLGLELDFLDKVQAASKSAVWLSGGLRTVRHLQAYRETARHGAAILTPAYLADNDPAEIDAIFRQPDQPIEITVEPAASPCGVKRRSA